MVAKKISPVQEIYVRKILWWYKVSIVTSTKIISSISSMEGLAYNHTINKIRKQLTPRLTQEPPTLSVPEYNTPLYEALVYRAPNAKKWETVNIEPPTTTAEIPVVNTSTKK